VVLLGRRCHQIADLVSEILLGSACMCCDTGGNAAALASGIQSSGACPSLVCSGILFMLGGRGKPFGYGQSRAVNHAHCLLQEMA
jgi:hypothetical protein